MALIHIFPFCKVLFDFVPVAYRGFIAVVLPVWRLAAKHYGAVYSRDGRLYPWNRRDDSGLLQRVIRLRGHIRDRIYLPFAAVHR